MRNPARTPSAVLAALMAASLSAGACAAQSGGSPTDSSDFTPRHLVLQPQLRIQATSSRGYNLQILPTDGGSWAAVMEMGGQVWMASERDCPAFKAALEGFGQLPPLYPGPYDLRDNPQPRQLGPRTPHGEFWTLTLAALAPDYTSLDMEISGSQGPYPRWASATVEAIKSCGRTDG